MSLTAASVESASFPYKSKLEITFVLINNSLVPVASLVPDNSSNKLDIATVVLLSILLAISVVCNLLVIATVISSYTLHKVPVYNLLAHLSFVCFLECALNVTLSITYVGVSFWNFGSVLCSLNSYSMLTLSAMICLNIAIVTGERCYVVCNPITYRKRAREFIIGSRVVFAIALVICAAVFIPVAVGNLLASVPFRRRYSCAPNGNSWQGYKIAIFVLLYLFPLCLIIVCCVRITSFVISNVRSSRKRLRVNGGGSPPARLAAAAYLWTEMRNIYVTLILVLGYVVLYLPHVFAVHKFQMSDAPYNMSTTPYEEFLQGLQLSDEEYSILQRYNKEIKNLFESIYKNSTDTISALRLKEVYVESDWQTVFIWGRYIFTLFFPALILTGLPELRFKTHALLCFSWRKNYNDRDGIIMSARPSNRADMQRRQQKKLSQTLPPSTNALHTPVLFSTPEGLFLRVLAPDASANASEVDPGFACIFCDVPVQLLEKEGGDKLMSEVRMEIEPEEEDAKNQVLKSKMVRFSPIVFEISSPELSFFGETFSVNADKSYLLSKDRELPPPRSTAEKLPVVSHSVAPRNTKKSPNASPLELNRSSNVSMKRKRKPSKIVAISKKKIPAPDFVKKKSSAAENGKQRWHY